MRQWLVIAAVLAAVWAGSIIAQPGPPEEPRATEIMPPEIWPDRGPHAPGEGIRHERRMLEAVRVSRMTEALKLTDEQIDKFIPRLKKMEEEQRAQAEKHHQIVLALDSLLQVKAKDELIKARLDELDKVDAEKISRLKTVRAELDGMLSLEQRAQWRVFNERFDQEIRHMVRDIREKRMKRMVPDRD